MARLIVPQGDHPEREQELGSSASAAVELALKRQRQRDTIQSLVSGLIVVGLLIGVLASLFALVDWGGKGKPIVTYVAEQPKPEELERPEVSQQARPNPAGPKSSRAKVIAAQLPTDLSVPVPDDPIPTGPFGMSDEIGEGWGDSEGDGSGGGGASFFGNYRRGSRVAYVVDFSGSMESTADGGGTRIAALKKELVRSIQGLDDKMRFTCLFFSSRAWTIDTEGPDYVGNGWNGLGDVPIVNWYPASGHVKQQVISQVQSMPADGGTSWYPALKMAFSMNPPPSIVYLLSDGEPRDGDDVLHRMKELNPNGTPIDTIAFELPGSPAAMLKEIAEKSGGKFSMVYKGELLKGRAAEKLTGIEFDP